MQHLYISGIYACVSRQGFLSSRAVFLVLHKAHTPCSFSCHPSLLISLSHSPPFPSTYHPPCLIQITTQATEPGPGVFCCSRINRNGNTNQFLYTLMRYRVAAPLGYTLSCHSSYFVLFFCLRAHAHKHFTVHILAVSQVGLDSFGPAHKSFSGAFNGRGRDQTLRPCPCAALVDMARQGGCWQVECRWSGWWHFTLNMKEIIMIQQVATASVMILFRLLDYLPT